MNSGSDIASEARPASDSERAQARPAHAARRPDAVRLRTHAAVAKAVSPNAAAFSQPAASIGAGPNRPTPAIASGKSGAAPV